MTTTVAAIDTAVVEEFAGRVLTDFAGAAGTAMTIVGDRLGLYQAMTGAGPTTAVELAERTRLHHRLVAEWLGAQTVSGYLRHDPATDTYELPVEHAMVLSVVASPAYVIGAAEVIAGQFLTLEHLETAFRGDGGVEYHRFPDTVMHGIERFFRTAYTHQLTQTWFPAVDGLVDRLDDGARVADVGCGHGAATLLMARTWPRSTFTGFDLDERAVTVPGPEPSTAAPPATCGSGSPRRRPSARAPSTSWCSSTRCTTWATRWPRCAGPATCSSPTGSWSPSSRGPPTGLRTASATQSLGRSWRSETG